jgi:hypothetical protein
MASTFSDLKIELIGTGEQSGTWGATTNVNLGTALGEAITGTADVAFSSADVTLTLTNTNTAQTARNLRLNLTGTSGGARNLILGSGCQIEKLYLVSNGLADAVTVKNTTGTGIAVPAGRTMFVFNNAVDVVDALSYFSGTVVSSAATITGGTINSTSIGATTASSGAFTTLAASGNTTLTGDLTVNGNTTLGNASGDTVTFNAATASIPNNLNFSGTGTIRLPNGTTGERPSPTVGMVRYNTTTAGFEGYTATGWGNIGGGASADGAIYENRNTISANYTLTTNFNGMSVSPLTINSGVVVTVPTGQRWVIL